MPLSKRKNPLSLALLPLLLVGSLAQTTDTVVPQTTDTVAAQSIDTLVPQTTDTVAAQSIDTLVAQSTAPVVAQNTAIIRRPHRIGPIEAFDPEPIVADPDDYDVSWSPLGLPNRKNRKDQSTPKCAFVDPTKPPYLTVDERVFLNYQCPKDQSCSAHGWCGVGMLYNTAPCFKNASGIESECFARPEAELKLIPSGFDDLKRDRILRFADDKHSAAVEFHRRVPNIPPEAPQVIELDRDPALDNVLGPYQVDMDALVQQYMNIKDQFGEPQISVPTEYLSFPVAAPATGVVDPAAVIATDAAAVAAAAAAAVAPAITAAPVFVPPVPTAKRVPIFLAGNSLRPPTFYTMSEAPLDTNIYRWVLLREDHPEEVSLHSPISAAIPQTVENWPSFVQPLPLPSDAPAQTVIPRTDVLEYVTWSSYDEAYREAAVTELPSQTILILKAAHTEAAHTEAAHTEAHTEAARTKPVRTKATRTKATRTKATRTKAVRTKATRTRTGRPKAAHTKAAN